MTLSRLTKKAGVLNCHISGRPYGTRSARPPSRRTRLKPVIQQAEIIEDLQASSYDLAQTPGSSTGGD